MNLKLIKFIFKVNGLFVMASSTVQTIAMKQAIFVHSIDVSHLNSDVEMVGVYHSLNDVTEWINVETIVMK